MQHENTKITPKGIDQFVIWIVVATLLLLGTIIYFSAKSSLSAKVATDSQVSLSVENMIHDWGTIDINGGVVSKSFDIKNTSESVLKLYNVVTSCMCTTAQLTTADKTSKKFGMHENGTNVFEVNPRETAKLLVEFDPAFHGPSGIGPISRIVSVDTNDANKPNLQFTLTAEVVKN